MPQLNQVELILKSLTVTTSTSRTSVSCLKKEGLWRRRWWTWRTLKHAWRFSASPCVSSWLSLSRTIMSNSKWFSQRQRWNSWKLVRNCWSSIEKTLNSSLTSPRSNLLVTRRTKRSRIEFLRGSMPVCPTWLLQRPPRPTIQGLSAVTSDWLHLRLEVAQLLCRHRDLSSIAASAPMRSSHRIRAAAMAQARDLQWTRGWAQLRVSRLLWFQTRTGSCKRRTPRSRKSLRMIATLQFQSECQREPSYLTENLRNIYWITRLVTLRGHTYTDIHLTLID